MNTDHVYDYSINVVLLTHRGIFKPAREHFEFRFCAESKEHAIVLASSNVKSKGFPYDEKIAQITNAIPVLKPILSDECEDRDHEECHALWCGCPHHQFEVPPLESAPLRSCAEIESEQDEAEYLASIEREERLEAV